MTKGEIGYFSLFTYSVNSDCRKKKIRKLCWIHLFGLLLHAPIIFTNCIFTLMEKTKIFSLITPYHQCHYHCKERRENT